MRSHRKHALSALFGAIALAASVAVASVALAGGGGVGTGGGGGGGGGGHQYTFPIRGAHDYGRGFGNGHEGHDVFANCGTKLVANHDAKVQLVDRHELAGNYIVLDTDGSGIDWAYMHLKKKAIPRQGSKVEKGDKIGEVGDTGNASGCHLHFEKWTSPGYYQGGHASGSVTKALKKWDKYS